MQRLCGIEPTMCQLALDSLVSSHSLRLTSHGRYARATEGYAFASDIGDGFVNQSANPASQVVPPGDLCSVRETFILRQPQRRRDRSDSALQKERAQWVRQWNEQQHDDAPT